MKLNLATTDTDKTYVFLYHHGPVASPTYRQIDMFFKQEKVASLTNVNFARQSLKQDTFSWFYYSVWNVDAATLADIQAGDDVYAIIYR
jgi:hypothetical protein